MFPVVAAVARSDSSVVAMVGMTRLSGPEITVAAHLCILLGNGLKAQIHTLMADLAVKKRQLVHLLKLPRVCIEDIKSFHEFLSGLISWGNEDALAKPVLVQYSFMMLDKSYQFQLSAQNGAQERAAFHRWEADKTRLLYAYSPACN